MDIESDMEIEDSLEAQAVTWLVRVTSGEAGPGTLTEFEQWRNADPEHESALANARRLWLDLGNPLQTRYAPRLASLPHGNCVGARRRRPRWIPAAAAAAVLALSIGVGHQWLTQWQFDQATSTGEQRTVALQDGSTMWLNTGSAADIQVDARQRHIDLKRGEAFFDVRHDTQRPFTVDAGLGQIKVLGTAFGVYREGDDVLVTVQRGRVEVSGGGTPPVVITPDQRVRVHAGDKIKRVEFVSADQNLSWRNGRLVYEDRPLSEILTDLNRYDNRLVLVRYPDANRIRINAMIDLARLDEWYDGLEQSFPVKVTRMGPVVWVRAADGSDHTTAIKIVKKTKA